MKEIFKKHSEDLRKALENVEDYHAQIEQVALHMREVFLKGKKILVAGNGGSAEQVLHFSDEMVGRYKQDRRPYPVIALTADPAVLTCIGNDYGYDQLFSRQVEALGQEGDMFIGLSTSGTSKNILAAAKKAHDAGMTVVALTGPKGELSEIADYSIVAPSEIGARMQELHLHAIHLLCEAFEPENIEK